MREGGCKMEPLKMDEMLLLFFETKEVSVFFSVWRGICSSDKIF
jgi:hypothetical protein